MRHIPDGGVQPPLDADGLEEGSEAADAALMRGNGPIGLGQLADGAAHATWTLARSRSPLVGPAEARAARTAKARRKFRTAARRAAEQQHLQGRSGHSLAREPDQPDVPGGRPRAALSRCDEAPLERPNGSIRVRHVVKYAQARAVSVELTLTDDMFVATIADNGIGGSEPQLGSRLRGRLIAFTPFGGRLEVSSLPGKDPGCAPTVEDCGGASASNRRLLTRCCLRESGSRFLL